MKSLSILLLLLLSIPLHSAVIGKDNRIEYWQAEPRIQHLADSVPSLWISDRVIQDTKQGFSRLITYSYQSLFQLCPSEKFVDEQTGPACSGALVGPDLVLTAGHCVRTQKECAEIKIVFGFAITKPYGQTPTKIQNSEIYSCTALLAHSVPDPDKGPDNTSGKHLPDYALLRLDRIVSGHAPLAIESADELTVGKNLFIIGYPRGLPLKLAGHGKVLPLSLPEYSNYFETDLDVFPANSGSPVFNAATLKIEGVLSMGNTIDNEDELFPQDISPVLPCKKINVFKHPDEAPRRTAITKTFVLSEIIEELNKVSH